MTVNVFNRCWSRIILETLVKAGVKVFCIAPGSRSTPLTLEAVRLQETERAVCYTHFDERGLGFFALGIAKSSNSPVAVIVTSGSAAANLFPAVVEARQSGVNLIVLTADRPPELLECGANQAILQANLFGNYPVATVSLPRPSEDYSPDYLISLLSQQLWQQKTQPGVVHINVPFAEPLYGADEEDIEKHAWLTPVQSWLMRSKAWVNYAELQNDVIMHEAWDQWRTKRGIIFAGRMPQEQAMGVALWAETMGWVLISDVQSSVSSPLPYADIWLANHTVKKKLLEADIVIQLGSHFVSKRVNQFLSEFRGEFWVVASGIKAVDPYHHSHTRFDAKIHHWLRAHPPLRQKPWLPEPQALSNFCGSFIEQQVGANLNEASLAYHLERILPNNGVLFLGNSLFIRLVDAFARLPENYSVYTNRGASGIDGLLATAAGIAFGSHQPLVAVLGDLSALYDLNSLALFKKLNQPVIILIINNNGGAIFDMLPVEENIKEKFYRMPHHTDFLQIASMFDLKYARPYTWADFGSVLKQAYSRREATVIEIKVSPNDATNTYKHLIEQIGQAVVG